MQPPEWKGAHPQRFSGGRIHLKPQGQLNNLLQPSLTQQQVGIRTFGQPRSNHYQFKPSLKIFEGHYYSQQKEIDLRGIKHLSLPEQPQKNRKQRGHVRGGQQTTKQLQPKGLRAFSSANQSKNQQWNLQSKMQAKARILGLEGQRNGLGVTSLGDKPYKYPQYQPNFYKSGGLIAGSTGFRVRSSDGAPIDPNKLKSIFTKPMWSQRVKMQQREQEKKAIDTVDDWEKTILKEANPKWNDPDTFFERMQKAAPPAKDAKKGAKK